MARRSRTHDDQNIDPNLRDDEYVPELDDGTSPEPAVGRKRNLGRDFDDQQGSPSKKPKKSEQGIKTMLKRLTQLNPPHPTHPWVQIELELGAEHKWPPKADVAKGSRRQDGDSSLSNTTLDRLHQIWLRHEVLAKECEGYELAIVQEGLTEARIKESYEKMIKQGVLDNASWINDSSKTLLTALYLWRDIQVKRIENHFGDYYLKKVRQGVKRRVDKDPTRGWILKPGFEWMRPDHCMNGKIMTDEEMAGQNGASAADTHISLIASVPYWDLDGKKMVFDTLIDQITADNEIPTLELRRLQNRHVQDVHDRLVEAERNKREVRATNEEYYNFHVDADGDAAKIAAVSRTMITHDEINGFMNERSPEERQMDDDSFNESKEEWLNERQEQHDLDRLQMIIHAKSKLDKEALLIFQRYQHSKALLPTDPSIRAAFDYQFRHLEMQLASPPLSSASNAGLSPRSSNAGLSSRSGSQHLEDGQSDGEDEWISAHPEQSSDDLNHQNASNYETLQTIENSIVMEQDHGISPDEVDNLLNYNSLSSVAEDQQPDNVDETFLCLPSLPKGRKSKSRV